MPSSRVIAANGIEMFLLEQGAGPLVLLCHGWPELSYSWRHQIPALASAGYRVVAPDMRGFGRTTAPADIDAYSIFDMTGDMVALVTALGERQAVIVGHDWGAPVAWHAAMFRPDIFRAVVGLSVPPPLRGRARPLDSLRESGITNFYWQYFQTPGVAERGVRAGRGADHACAAGGPRFLRSGSLAVRSGRQGIPRRCRSRAAATGLDDRGGAGSFHRGPTGNRVSAAVSTGTATSTAIGS